MRGMNAKHWLATTALAAVFAGSGALPAMAQELELRQPQGALGSAAHAVSDDGSVVVGYVRFPQGVAGTDRATVWGEGEEIDQLSDIGSQAFAVSADGSVIVGFVRPADHTRAFRWTRSGGGQELDLPTDAVSAIAEAVSADGLVVAGTSRDGSNIPTAFRWTEADGTHSLGALDGGNRSEAYGVSGDGRVIVGASNSATSGPWMEAFRWTEADGMVELGKLNNSDSSRAYAASFDGGVIVGWAQDGAVQQQRAFRWTEADGMQSLGVLNGGNLSLAYDVSPDGLVVVGSAADGEDGNVQRAFRWTEAGGMQSVEDWLRDEGATIAQNITRTGYGVNADGSVVVGETWAGQMFIARAVSGNGDPDDGDPDDEAPGGNGGADDDSDDDAPDGNRDDGGDPDENDSGGNGGQQGGDPPPGLITVDDLGASLTSAGMANSAATNSLGTLMNGVGSRPLDRRAASGRSIAWLGGDWGRDNHGARDGELRFGEIGVGHNFGGLQLNGVFGVTALDQDTLLGGRTDIDAKYVKLEMLTRLHETDDGGLWFAATATGLWGDADIRRNYLANGGLTDTSTGRTDVEGHGVRARLQWENLLPNISPYGELSYARSCLDAYVESGGAFPAAFDRLCDKATEARIGLDARIPVTEQFRLIGTLDGVHRFEDRGANVTGQVIGLGAFDLGQVRHQQDWLRGGVGFELDIASTTLSVMANATTRGESASTWIAANWRVRF